MINKQREVIYAERNKILDGESLRDNTVTFIEEVVRGNVAEFANPDISPEEWDLDGLVHADANDLPDAAHEGVVRPSPS